MKSIKLIALGITMFFISHSSHAQVSINVNLGGPSWGPPVESSVDFYYLPEIETYYDIHTTQFIYLSRGSWIRSNHLPGRYRNYNLERGHKIVLNDYHGSSPYSNYHHDRVKYNKGYYKAQGNNGHGGNNYRDNGHHNNGNEGHGNGGHGHGKKH
jgi:hypothetical protein